MQQQGGERTSPSVLWKVATYLARSTSTGGGPLWVKGGGRAPERGRQHYPSKLTTSYFKAIISCVPQPDVLANEVVGAK